MTVPEVSAIELTVLNATDEQTTNLNNALNISTDKDQRPKTMEKHVALCTAEKNVSTEKAI